MANSPANVAKLDRPTEAGDDVREQLNALRSDVAGLTAALGDYVKEQKNAMQSSASAGIDALKSAGRAGIEATGRKASEVKSSTEDMVRENPTSAIAISAALGFVVGLLSRRA
ncbi:MAG: hypothetical protein ABI459_00445 [Deltaproteobacteria bacterium]